MIQILRKVLRDFPNWERGPQYSLVLAALVLALSLALAFAGPAELRIPALVGAFGALVVLQAAILFSYRHMVNEYAQAQRAYLTGDFAEAVRLMEARRIDGRARWRELTLLANAYRQVGRLDDSIDAVEAALVFAPEHHFPLFALGRARLEHGDYAAAADALARARAAGAPPETQLELAEARWRAGDADAAHSALAAFDQLPEPDDPLRILQAAVLRWRLTGGSPPAAEVVAAGLPGWLALEARCATSPYAAALAADRTAFTANGTA